SQENALTSAAHVQIRPPVPIEIAHGYSPEEDLPVRDAGGIIAGVGPFKGELGSFGSVREGRSGALEPLSAQKLKLSKPPASVGAFGKLRGNVRFFHRAATLLVGPAQPELKLHVRRPRLHLRSD